MHNDVKFFNGNVDAFRLCEIVSYVSNFWDDLIDKDKEIDERRINSVMLMLLVELPQNRFYRAHMDSIVPLMTAGAIEYLVSREYEKAQEPHGMELAFGMRYSIGALVSFVAAKCGADIATIAAMNKSARPDRIGDYLKEHHV